MKGFTPQNMGELTFKDEGFGVPMVDTMESTYHQKGGPNPCTSQTSLNTAGTCQRAGLPFEWASRLMGPEPLVIKLITFALFEKWTGSL